MKSKREFFSVVALLALVGLIAGVTVQGADTANVTSTVTVQNISVSVSDGTVAYGVLAVNTAKDTTSGGLNDTQVSTNDGNVNEDLNIRGTNSASWTLAASAGASQYKHEFCTAGTGAPDPCDATPTYTALTTSNQTLSAGVASGGTKRFDLRLTTPTSTSDFTQQSVNVVVVATAS